MAAVESLGDLELKRLVTQRGTEDVATTVADGARDMELCKVQYATARNTRNDNPSEDESLNICTSSSRHRQKLLVPNEVIKPSVAQNKSKNTTKRRKVSITKKKKKLQKVIVSSNQTHVNKKVNKTGKLNGDSDDSPYVRENSLEDSDEQPDVPHILINDVPM